MPRRGDRLTIADKFLLKSIEGDAEQIADLQDAILEVRKARDDHIREGIQNDIAKTEIGRAAELAVEQIRHIETFRYSRESRRKQVRNPGPQRD
jgi:hypothetical protein